MCGFILKTKFKTLALLFLAALLITTLYNFLEIKIVFPSDDSHTSVHTPVMIWWTPFSAYDLKEIECGNYKCKLTDNRAYAKHPGFRAYLFYASNINYTNFPLPRDGSIVWALLHEESPRNVAFLLHDDGLGLFNYSSTFSRYSDFPITLQYLPDKSLLTDTNYFIPTSQKNILLKSLAPVLYLQSDCDTPLERDAYVAELMKYVQIDSYGKCLNNRKLPEKFSKNPLENLFEDDFMHFVSQYKFTIAFENSVCHDYITEKLWRPLIAGSVPIYKGSPTVKDWLPNDNSAIIANEFPNPRALAEHILKLNANDELYEQHLKHKLNRRITNTVLDDAMSKREWGIDPEVGKMHFIQAYECFVCEKLHTDKTKNKRVNRKHYDCPMPRSDSWWSQHWQAGQCEAKVLKRFIEDLRLSNFTFNSFFQEINKYRDQKKCWL